MGFMSGTMLMSTLTSYINPSCIAVMDNAADAAPQQCKDQPAAAFWRDVLTAWGTTGPTTILSDKIILEAKLPSIDDLTARGSHLQQASEVTSIQPISDVVTRDQLMGLAQEMRTILRELKDWNKINSMSRVKFVAEAKARKEASSNRPHCCLLLKVGLQMRWRQSLFQQYSTQALLALFGMLWFVSHTV